MTGRSRKPFSHTPRYQGLLCGTFSRRGLSSYNHIHRMYTCSQCL